MGALIFVTDEQANRCAKSDAVLDTRLKVDLVFFITLRLTNEPVTPTPALKYTHRRSEVALAGSSPTQLHLDILSDERQALHRMLGFSEYVLQGGADVRVGSRR